MRKNSYFNKVINLTKLEAVFEMDDKYYERFLEEYDYEEADSRTGFNHFSILLTIKGNKINEIQRIAHCHMCGGQGTDRVVKVFPFKSLEVEASIIMDKLFD
jgi:hypothetical protein